MSRYKFALQPSGAIAQDVALTMQMVSLPKPVAPEIIAEVIPEVPCETTFVGWAVAVERGNESALPGGSLRPWMFIAEDNVEYVSKYPDACFAFYIKLVGNLCQGQAIEWTWDDGGAGLPDLYVVQYDTDPLSFSFFHNDHLLTTPSIFDGSAITLNATVDGDSFGVPIYLANDNAIYSFYWHSWSVFDFNFVTYESRFTYFLFEEYQGDIVNGWALNGYLWRAADTLTSVVTQTLGPAVTLPTVSVAQCTTWYFFRNIGESYAGTEFTVQMQVDGNDFGDPITLTCEV